MKGKINISADMLKHGAVVFASAFAGMAGYKAGVRMLEKSIPSIADKISLTRAIVGTLSSSEEDDEDEDDE